MPPLPGNGAQDGLLGYLLEQLVQMPYLWWVWAFVLFTCLAFTVLDNKKAIGIPQGIYGVSLGVVMLLREVEMHSFGYFTIWVLGAGGLLTYLGMRYLSQVTITR